MKVKVAQKDIAGHLFLLALAAACITIGARVLSNDHPVSGTFGLVLGVALIAVSASMALRKE